MLHIYMIYMHTYIYILGFPGGWVVNNLPASVGDARDVGSVPGSGRSSGGGHEKKMATCSSILAWKNLLGRGTWRAAVHGVTKRKDTTKWLTNNRYLRHILACVYASMLSGSSLCLLIINKIRIKHKILGNHLEKKCIAIKNNLIVKKTS